MFGEKCEYKELLLLQFYEMKELWTWVVVMTAQ